MVIANILVSACLANRRTMLTPGGILLLGEITSKLARIPMISGTLPGWWNGENDNRKWGPTLLVDLMIIPCVQCPKKKSTT